ncbi:MAG: hypothetical protein ACYC4H_07910 [Desulfocucumaceae bacterium]
MFIEDKPIFFLISRKLAVPVCGTNSYYGVTESMQEITSTPQKKSRGVKKVYDRIKKYLLKIWQIKLYPIVFILLSLVLLYQSEKHEFFAKSLESDPNKLFYAVLHEVGISLFILGSITILLELGDFREYFFRRLSDIIIKDEYISFLHEDKLKKMETGVQKALYFRNQPIDKKSFFYKVQNSIIPVISGCFFDDYEIWVECKIEGSLIKKTIKKRFEIVNPTPNKLEEPVPVQSYMKSIANKDNKELLKIERMTEKLIENGTTKEKVYTTGDFKINFCELKDNSKYDLIVSCENTITVKEKAVIEVIYTTIAPLSDPHFLQRVTKPCRRYKCVFLSRNNAYNLTGFGFGFMESSKFYRNDFTDGIELCFKDWILPGDGVIYTLLKPD